MNFINAEGKGEFLNYEDLVNGHQFYRTTYVVDVKSYFTQFKEPYYSLFVRTTEGYTLPCFVFKIDDFDELGLKLNLLKGKYVKLNCKAVENDGRFILNFIGLELINTPNESISSMFQQKIVNIEKYYEELNGFFASTIGKEIPKYLTLMSYPQIYDGFVGGYIKFCWDVLMHIQIVCIDQLDEGNFGIELANILYNVFIHYNLYLDRCNKINIITDSDKIDLVSAIPNDNMVNVLSRNCFSALIGLGKPSHLISVIIHSTFKYIDLNNQVKASWNTLRPGGESECGDYVLSRY